MRQSCIGPAPPANSGFIFSYCIGMLDGEESSPVVPKQEYFREPSRASPASSLGTSGEIDGEGEVEGNVNLVPTVPLKRKGGRKPVRPSFHLFSAIC